MPDECWSKWAKEDAIPKGPGFWLMKVEIETDILTLLAVHGNLCLSLRHPGNQGMSRDKAICFVKALGKHLVNLGALTPEQLKEAEMLENLT